MKHASATPGTVDLSTCPSLPTMGSDVACCVDGECFRTGLPSPPQGVLASWSQLTPGGDSAVPNQWWRHVRSLSFSGFGSEK